MRALCHADTGALVYFHHFPGTDPVFVYLAGLGGAATALFPEVVAGSGLAVNTAIMPDWLGSGYSDRPTNFGYSIEEHAQVIAWFLDELGLRQCIVIAHSMGGAVAIMLAEQRPDLVQRLVLAEGNLDARGGAFSSGIASLSEQQFVATGYPALLEGFRQRSALDNQTSAVAAGMLQLAAPYALHRSAVSLVAGVQPSWRERLYRLTIPRLYLFGEHSLPDPDLEVLPARGVQTAVIPQAGHFMMIENPDGFATAILAFMTA